MTIRRGASTTRPTGELSTSWYPAALCLLYTLFAPVMCLVSLVWKCWWCGSAGGVGRHSEAAALRYCYSRARGHAQ
ncbi:TPA: hypothetical protein ACV7ZU_001733 [Escherichia coli]